MAGGEAMIRGHFRDVLFLCQAQIPSGVQRWGRQGGGTGLYMDAGCSENCIERQLCVGCLRVVWGKKRGGGQNQEVS